MATSTSAINPMIDCDEPNICETFGGVANALVCLKPKVSLEHEKLSQFESNNVCRCYEVLPTTSVDASLGMAYDSTELQFLWSTMI